MSVNSTPNANPMATKILWNGVPTLVGLGLSSVYTTSESKKLALHQPPQRYNGHSDTILLLLNDKILLLLNRSYI
jgi:hypothetical protein